jgi:DNA-binding NarL/FixJ family response regulator
MTKQAFLVDDQELFLEGLREIVEKRAGLEVVGLSTDGLAAVDLIRETRPDLVLMGVSLPGLSGIEATRQIASDAKILCLSMRADTRSVTTALVAGAAGYLLKSCSREELVTAVGVVLGGQTYLSPAIASTVVEALKQRDSSTLSLLSTREREVLQLLAEGRSAGEIAERLHLSPKTIHTHREHVMEKLRIRSLAGLVKYAIREGVTPCEPEYCDKP